VGNVAGERHTTGATQSIRKFASLTFIRRVSFFFLFIFFLRLLLLQLQATLLKAKKMNSKSESDENRIEGVFV
jgi:hypothetical protein